jgi:hypothetical protein
MTLLAHACYIAGNKPLSRGAFSAEDSLGVYFAQVEFRNR